MNCENLSESVKILQEPTHHIPHRFNNPPTARPNNNSPIRPVEDTIQLAEQRPDTIIMMAGFDKQTVTPTSEHIYPMIMTAEKTPSSVNNAYLWLIDSATSSHISGNKDLFHTMHSIPLIKINRANGESFIADQCGTINVKVISDPCWGLEDIPITLTDIIYVPKLKSNLLLVGRMTNLNINVHFSKHTSWLIFKGKIIAYGPKENNLYTYIAFPIDPTTKTADFTSELSGPTLWHYRLIHMSYHTIDNMRNLQTVENFHPGVHHSPNPQCLNCPYGKQKQAPFQKVEKLPSNIGDLIVSDLCGPFELSIGNFKYFITWIKTKTCFASVDFIRNKESSTITASFKNYTTWLTQQKSTNIKWVRSNNSREYMGRQFRDICAKSGIVHETTSPHTPKHNRIAERYNRTFQEGALMIRHDAGLSSRFWVSAIHTVNFIKNYILHSRLSISPYEAFWGTKPRINWLRTYGSKCWALIPKAIQLKNQFKSVEGTVYS